MRKNKSSRFLGFPGVLDTLIQYVTQVSQVTSWPVIIFCWLLLWCRPGTNYLSDWLITQQILNWGLSLSSYPTPTGAMLCPRRDASPYGHLLSARRCEHQSSLVWCRPRSLVAKSSLAFPGVAFRTEVASASQPKQHVDGLQWTALVQCGKRNVIYWLAPYQRLAGIASLAWSPTLIIGPR